MVAESSILPSAWAYRTKVILLWGRLAKEQPGTEGAEKNQPKAEVSRLESELKRAPYFKKTAT